MKRKLISIAVIAAMAASMVTGCSSSSSSSTSGTEEKTEASGETIKIGTISPNTGSMAAYGDAVVKAWELARDEINAAGGVNGQQIELIEKDDQMDPTETLNAFNSLVAEGVTAVLGSVSSGCTSAITDAADEEGIVLVTPTSTADSITTTDNYVFRACYADSFQGKIAAKYAADNGYKEVGVLYCASDTYSKGLYDSFAAACEDYGITVKDAESVADIQTSSEFTNQWAALVQSGVQFVFAPFYYYTVGPYIVPQARQAGYTGIIMGADGYDGSIDYISEGSNLDDWNGVMFTNHYDPADTSEAVTSFVKAYQDKYNGETPNALAALAYDSLNMVAQAMTSSGATDSASLRDALADQSAVYNCVTGTFSLDGTGTPVKGASIIEFSSDGSKVTTKLNSVVAGVD